VNQKLRPSLQAPFPALVPVLKLPITARSAAFHRETTFAPRLVSRTRSPSKAAEYGLLMPLAVNVARIAPLEARTTEIELAPALGTQMLTPSNAGRAGIDPTVTV
jgi:hypothetical protein